MSPVISSFSHLFGSRNTNKTTNCFYERCGLISANNNNKRKQLFTSFVEKNRIAGFSIKHALVHFRKYRFVKLFSFTEIFSGRTGRCDRERSNYTHTHLSKNASITRELRSFAGTYRSETPVVLQHICN